MKIWQTSCTRLREHPAAAARRAGRGDAGAGGGQPAAGGRRALPRRSSGRAGRGATRTAWPRGWCCMRGCRAFAAACWPGRRWPRPGSSSRPCWRTRWPRRISSASTPGAGLAVTLCCALAPAAALQPLAAFAGAMAGVGLVLVFAEATGASRMTLVLAGVAISNLFTALIDAVTTIFPDALLGYADFRMGGLAGVTMARLGPAAVLIGVSLGAGGEFGRAAGDSLSLGPETCAEPGGWPCGRCGFCFWRWRPRWPGPPSAFAGWSALSACWSRMRCAPCLAAKAAACSSAPPWAGAAFLTLCDLIARAAAAPFELPWGTRC